MSSDLFSTFDYGFGVAFMESSMILWVSSIFLFFLLINWLDFWFSRNLLSTFLNNLSKSVSNGVMPFQVGSLGSGVSFVTSLFLLLFTMNMFGMGPYVFGVSCHFAFAMSFSFSIWFSILLFNIFSNGVSFFGSFVLPDLPVVASMLMVWIEVLSNVIRALTLSLRLCLNLASGQIIMGLLGSFSNLLVINILGVSSIFCSLGCMVLLVMDLFIACLQAGLFVGLIVMYMDEIVTP